MSSPCDLRGAGMPVFEGKHLVYDAIVTGSLSGHKEIALGVALDALQRVAGMQNEDLVDDIADAQQLARLDIDVGGLPTDAALHKRLMHVDAGVRQGIAAAGVAGHQQNRAEACRLANTGRYNRSAQSTHG